MSYETLVHASPWVAAAAVAVPVAGKIIILTGKIIALRMALRGADPKDRPQIIKELSGLFRWWQRQ